MSEKADHLIERAAALLRSATATHVPEHPIDGADQVAAPLPPPNGGAAPPPLPPGIPPLRVAATRPAPVQIGGPLPGAGPRTALFPQAGTTPAVTGAISSAADIPPSPSRPPITLETLERAGVMVARNNRTRVAEEYRIVIGRVLRALHEDPAAEARWEPVAANVIMVTSARPGEGKSFTALNIAASIAQNAAESVLLVDLDAKIHSVSDELGVGPSLGFMDLISQPGLSPDEVVLPSELPHFAFMPLGNQVRRRDDETVDDSFDVRPITPVIHRLSQRYPKSLIVLDCPPCLSSSDPHTLAPYVAEVVMVVEAERTQRSDVEAALELVRVCPNVTMLLNKVRSNSRTTFGTYDYFGTYT